MEAVELSGGDVDLPVKRWRYRALAIGLALVLLAGVGALLLTPDGEPTPEQALAAVRDFFSAQRSATFTGSSESTYGPGSAGVGHTSTTRSQITGELRLPDQLHILTDSGDWADETIIHGNDVFSRSADSKAALAAEKWDKWDAGGFGQFGGSRLPAIAAEAGLPAAALEDAAAVMTTMSAGFPVDLDTLFAKLSQPERVGPNRIRATVKLGDMVPAEMRKLLEDQKAEFDKGLAEAKAAGGGGSEITVTSGGVAEGFDPGADIEEFDGASFDLNFDVPLTVIVGYGPDGRLDALIFDTQDDMGDGEFSKEHEEYNFANWGKPVAVTLPSADQVDATPHLDEEGLARVQQRTTVMGLSAPPAGWVLGSLEVQELDDETETCDSVDLEYRADGVESQEDFGADVPQISVSTVAPGCQWLDENLPDMNDARTVRVGAWTAKLVDDAEDNMFSYLSEGVTAVLQVNGSTVVAASNLPEADFLNALKSLAPFDLAKQPVARLAG